MNKKNLVTIKNIIFLTSKIDSPVRHLLSCLIKIQKNSQWISNNFISLSDQEIYKSTLNVRVLAKLDNHKSSKKIKTSNIW